MIKVNLLDSITDRPKVVAAVETKVTNPRTQTQLMALACGSLLVLGMAFDYMSARAQHAEATKELERQQQIAQQMAAVNKEQAELEKKTNDVQARISAIQKLRAAQQGPVAVLSAINERLPRISEFRLESVQQKNGELIITGDSPNEAAVTQFGRSLEFSSGLFTNVSIETERKALQEARTQKDSTPSAAEVMDTPKVETVSFIIKCKYAAPVGSNSSAAPTVPAAAAPAASAPAQVAQK